VLSAERGSATAGGFAASACVAMRVAD